ncbi:hypothetical protein SAMN05421823_10180 [Catalinimonas alkaloidigena]|uniref:Uncharacterized protein n=1 Tax=Catalinimonas alkaloidigena TaxID=1075417 RepID=A0A1G8WIP9_9BACT|nr:hypothetical protein [Catalinimonas alkaloidigena]SDJ77440.1 hypothetical protein SAMN05421823_10180 [Catalinimonas alkaloidigena]
MEELAFDVMEELHFVTSFRNLCTRLECDEKQLTDVLKDMIGRGWVRSVPSPEHEREKATAPQRGDEFSASFFLATKEGLLAHHGMGH